MDITYRNYVACITSHTIDFHMRCQHFVADGVPTYINHNYDVNVFLK